MQPPDDRRAPLKPPQFALRTLLLGVTLCAVACAAAQWLSPLAVAGFGFLFLCIVAHVAGNSLGTRLRENGSQPLPPGEQTAGRQVRRSIAADEFAEATQLSRHQTLGRPQWIATLIGIVCGGLGGGLGAALLSRVFDQSIILLGVVAFATLGGIGAFLMYSFVQVGWNAIIHAQKAAEPNNSREVVSEH